MKTKLFKMISLFMAVVMITTVIPIGTYANESEKNTSDSFSAIDEKEIEIEHEIESKRTENSKTFITSDGYYYQVSVAVPIHKQVKGLWEDIDKVDESSVKNVYDVQVVRDTTKTKSSLRTLPLVKVFRERLLYLYQKQEEYKELCGNSYNYEFEEYICVDPLGNLLQPNYISDAFPRLLERNGLRHIRFHDLRHSCASLLLANGVSMKQIQEWLGHSDFSTTANIYAHLDYSSKISSAGALENGLSDALSVYA